MEKPKFAMQWYPWYVHRWRGSKMRLKLTPMARYIYRELLDVSYVEGSLPSDIALLAKLADVSLKSMRQEWPSISPVFELREDGQLHHSTVDEVLSVAMRSREQKANAGRTSGERRANNRSTDVQQTFNGRSTNVEQYTVRDIETDTDSSETLARKGSPTTTESTDMERICREAAERHPNRNRSASPDQICQALLSNGHSDADSLAKFESWSVEYAEETESSFATKILDLIARRVYMIQPKSEESIYPDFTPRPNGGG